MRNLTCASLLFALTSTSFATLNGVHDFAIKGAGAQSCTNFINSSTSNDDKLKLYGGWIEGYITSINMNSKDTYDVTSFQSSTLLLKLIYSICKKNSNQNFFSAANQVILALGPTRLTKKSRIMAFKYRDKVVLVNETIIVKMKSKLRDMGYSISNESELTGEDVKSLLKYQANYKLPLTGLPDESTLMTLFYK